MKQCSPLLGTRAVVSTYGSMQGCCTAGHVCVTMTAGSCNQNQALGRGTG
jgi:hypothetical protein